MTKERLPIELPPHLFIPEGAQSIDARRLSTVTAGTNKALFMRITCPAGYLCRIISYAIYNDGLLEQDYEFLPMVSGIRVFPFHGNPVNNYKIALGLAPDLSNSSLIPCQLTLQPLQSLEWYVTNTSAVDTEMGLRVVGYLENSIGVTTPRFGT